MIRYTPIYIGPGVYIIHCKPTNKYYIGETDNIAERCGGHYKQLIKKSTQMS